jgi:YfiH family protein
LPGDLGDPAGDDLVIRSPALGDITHGFFSRHQGGEPDLSTLGQGLVCVRARQTHSAIALVVDAPLSSGDAPEADALVTVMPGLALTVVTADCGPVLLADPVARVIAAVHAGWRGARSGVLEAAVEAMVRLGGNPACMIAVVGPMIQQPSYEVDELLRARFETEDAPFFEPARAEHYLFDLPGYIAMRLREKIGIAQVASTGIDTYTNESCFASYRRATHRGEEGAGRQASVIALGA